jgi:hypothetical protein
MHAGVRRCRCRERHGRDGLAVVASLAENIRVERERPHHSHILQRLMIVGPGSTWGVGTAARAGAAHIPRLSCQAGCIEVTAERIAR